MGPTDRRARSTRVENSDASELDIPPTVTCAKCGRYNCDGCPVVSHASSEALFSEGAQSGLFPWEVGPDQTYVRRLVLTALITAHPDQKCHEVAPQGSVLRAFYFAVICEALAICSFALPWALGFTLLFPRLVFALMSSYQVITITVGILAILVMSVVFLHLLWGWTLEWALRRQGISPRYALGQRFGLYACGWDLLASPAGMALVWGVAGWDASLLAVKHGVSAPKLALFAYLSRARHVEPTLHRAVLWRSFAITGPIFFGAILGVPAYLLWHWFSSTLY